MDDDFRKNIKTLSKEASKIVGGYFRGETHNANKVKEAMKMLGMGVKVEHMDQIKEQGDKSLAVRLLKFLPTDKARDEYIKLTHPQVPARLLQRPKLSLAKQNKRKRK